MRIPFSLAFLALVFGEIAGFILVGKTIGVLPTLGLVLLGMIVGVLLLRLHGIATLVRARAEIAAGRTAARPLAEGAVLALGALLVILPGFLTDLIGILLFIPGVRDALWRAVRRRVEIRTFQAGRTAPESAATVDLDRSEYGTRANADSPWRLGKPGA
jgi:UPF0716 protein FxsA